MNYYDVTTNDTLPKRHVVKIKNKTPAASLFSLKQWLGRPTHINLSSSLLINIDCYALLILLLAGHCMAVDREFACISFM